MMKPKVYNHNYDFDKYYSFVHSVEMAKVYILILLYLSLVITVKSLKGSPKGKPEQTIRYTKTECSSSNKSVDSYFCFVKAYSRSVTTLNFGANITKPLNFINVCFDSVTFSVNIYSFFYLDFAHYGIQIWDNLSVQTFVVNHLMY